MRAEFVQTKQIAALKRPLVTMGRLTFSRTQGVLWQIEQPYRLSYVFSEERIVEIGSDGKRRVRETREVPGLTQIGRVFRAVLGANSDALREHFEVTAQGYLPKWAIGLKPRQTQLAQYLSGMQLSGGRFVEESASTKRRRRHTDPLQQFARSGRAQRSGDVALHCRSSGSRRNCWPMNGMRLRALLWRRWAARSRHLALCSSRDRCRCKAICWRPAADRAQSGG